MLIIQLCKFGGISMNKIILLILTLLIMISIANASSSIFMNQDWDIHNNDEWGWYYYILFPFEDAVIDFLAESHIVENITVSDDETFLDVNDDIYYLNSPVMDRQLDQLAFLQCFNWIQYAWRNIAPLNQLYFRADNNVTVECYPHYDGGNYEFICYPAP